MFEWALRGPFVSLPLRPYTIQRGPHCINRYLQTYIFNQTRRVLYIYSLNPQGMVGEISENGKYIWDGNSWSKISDIEDSSSKQSAPPIHAAPPIHTAPPIHAAPSKVGISIKMKNQIALIGLWWNIIIMGLIIYIAYDRHEWMHGEVSNEAKTLDAYYFFFYIGLLVISALANIYFIYKADRKNS